MYVIRFMAVLTKKNPKFFVGESLRSLKDIIFLYIEWNWLGKVMRSTSPTEEDVAAFPLRARSFSEHIQKVVSNSIIKRRVYLHILVEDIPRYLHFWHSTLGIGLGAISTQAGETKNLDCYNGTEGHCNHGTSAMNQVVEYDTRKTLYCLDKREPRTNLICRRCTQPGHQQNSLSCVLHPDTRTAYKFEEFENTLRPEELEKVHKHADAYVLYYRRERKKGFGKMNTVFF